MIQGVAKMMTFFTISNHPFLNDEFEHLMDILTAIWNVCSPKCMDQ